MEDTEKPTTNNKPLVIIVVVVIVLLGLAGFVIRKITQKVSNKLGEKTAEKMIEKATGGKADVDINDNQMTIKTNEGTFSTSTDLPKDWPKDAPVYPGSTVTYSGSSNPENGSSGFSIMTTTKDPVQKVADYYNKELVSQGWKIISTQNISGSTVLSSSKDSRNLVISATTSDDKTAITLVVAAEK